MNWDDVMIPHILQHHGRRIEEAIRWENYLKEGAPWPPVLIASRKLTTWGECRVTKCVLPAATSQNCLGGSVAENRVLLFENSEDEKTKTGVPLDTAEIRRWTRAVDHHWAATTLQTLCDELDRVRAQRDALREVAYGHLDGLE